MSKFTPVNVRRSRTKFLMVRITPNMEHALNVAKANTGLPRQELIEQMLKHCLADMGVVWAFHAEEVNAK